jgi:YesN/AraC family two-component response regulator
MTSLTLRRYFASNSGATCAPNVSVMDFAASASEALAHVSDTVEQPPILILSDINMPAVTNLKMCPSKMKEMRPGVLVHTTKTQSGQL